MAYLGRLKLKTAPTEEIIATTDLKEQLRIDYTSTDEDDLIDDIITEVREYIEQRCNRAFLTQSWYFYLDEFPSDDYIELPRTPLQSINSISYVDYENTVTTLGTSYYNWDVTNNAVYLEYNRSWPSFTPKPYGAVIIDFTAGSTTIASFKNDNMDLYQLNLALASKLFDNRELLLDEIPIKLTKRNFKFK